MLFPMMPYTRFRNMSDEDVMSLVAYLNTLPPVKHKVERSQVDFPVSALIKSAPQPAGIVPPPDHGNRMQIRRVPGRPWPDARSATRSRKRASRKPGRTLAGGERFAFPGVVVVSANITPDPQTGIGRWSEQDFVDKFQSYREYAQNGSPKVGPENFTLMPWLDFSQLESDDLRAIYSFLRTQKPVYHAVDSHPGFEKTQLVTKK